MQIMAVSVVRLNCFGPGSVALGKRASQFINCRDNTIEMIATQSAVLIRCFESVHPKP
jgi:hypothetical protein